MGGVLLSAFQQDIWKSMASQVTVANPPRALWGDRREQSLPCQKNPWKASSFCPTLENPKAFLNVISSGPKERGQKRQLQGECWSVAMHFQMM